MKDYEEESYKRYKQYRRNKYRYEQEQLVFPLMIVLVGAAILAFWKKLVIAAITVVFVIVVFLLYRKHRKKQIQSTQPLLLTSTEAQQGAELSITIKNTAKPITLDIVTPSNAKNGQTFVIKNVLVENNQGKKEKKNIWFRIEVQE